MVNLGQAAGSSAGLFDLNSPVCTEARRKRTRGALSCESGDSVTLDFNPPAQDSLGADVKWEEEEKDKLEETELCRWSRHL